MNSKNSDEENSKMDDNIIKYGPMMIRYAYLLSEDNVTNWVPYKLKLQNLPRFISPLVLKS